MGEIIARFADGRILVQEEKLCEQEYISGGVPFRIGHIKTVEKVLSIDARVSGSYGNDGQLIAPLKEVGISGDTIQVVLRRGDLGTPVMTGIFSGAIASGSHSGYLVSGLGFGLEVLVSGALTLTGPIAGSGGVALGKLSGITSGIGHFEQLASGLEAISGVVNILANVVGI